MQRFVSCRQPSLHLLFELKLALNMCTPYLLCNRYTETERMFIYRIRSILKFNIDVFIA